VTTTAAAVVDRLGRANLSSDETWALLDSVPAWQWAVPGGWWPDLAQHCPSRVAPDVPRRGGNGLNVEVGAPLPRCLEKSPDGRGLVWWMSGGSVLAYGHCRQHGCPRCDRQSPPT
jgi:hypothetical protein